MALTSVWKVGQADYWSTAHFSAQHFAVCPCCLAIMLSRQQWPAFFLEPGRGSRLSMEFLALVARLMTSQLRSYRDQTSCWSAAQLHVRCWIALRARFPSTNDWWCCWSAAQSLILQGFFQGCKSPRFDSSNYPRPMLECWPSLPLLRKNIILFHCLWI
jgi:hypothetical protein